MAYVLHQLLVARARLAPDKAAVISGEHSLSYGELVDPGVPVKRLTYIIRDRCRDIEV